MTDSNDSTIQPIKFRLIDTMDELNRARALLHAACLIVEHLEGPDRSKAEMNALDSLGTVLNAIEDILAAERSRLDALGDAIDPRRQAGQVVETVN